MEEGDKKTNRLRDIASLSRSKIYPLAAIVGLVIAFPLLYKKMVVDNLYCGGSKELYLGFVNEKIAPVSIISVDRLDYFSIKYNDSVSYKKYDYIRICSEYSKFPEKTLYTKDIREGDSIYKAPDSNEFTIIQEGKKYLFDIDPDRD